MKKESVAEREVNNIAWERAEPLVRASAREWLQKQSMQKADDDVIVGIDDDEDWWFAVSECFVHIQR